MRAASCQTFDVELTLFADPASVYPPESAAGCMALLQAIYSNPSTPTPQTRLHRDSLAYYMLLDVPESSDAALQWADQRWLSQGVREAVRGSWALDHDEWEAAVSHLANPSAQLIEAERSATILTLSQLGPPGSGKLLHRFCRFLRPTLNSGKLRSAYLGALLEADFEAGWVWVKQGGFEEDLWEERDGDEEAAQVAQEEGERLLLQTMDYCLKRESCEKAAPSDLPDAHPRSQTQIGTARKAAHARDRRPRAITADRLPSQPGVTPQWSVL